MAGRDAQLRGDLIQSVKLEKEELAIGCAVVSDCNSRCLRAPESSGPRAHSQYTVRNVQPFSLRTSSSRVPVAAMLAHPGPSRLPHWMSSPSRI